MAFDMGELKKTMILLTSLQKSIFLLERWLPVKGEGDPINLYPKGMCLSSMYEFRKFLVTAITDNISSSTRDIAGSDEESRSAQYRVVVALLHGLKEGQGLDEELKLLRRLRNQLSPSP